MLEPTKFVRRLSKLWKLRGSLEYLSTEDFVSFKQKRKIYERHVNEKSAEQGVPIPATSYRNSIQNPILEMFVVAQWVPVSSVAEITEENLKTMTWRKSRKACIS